MKAMEMETRVLDKILDILRQAVLDEAEDERIREKRTDGGG